MPPITTNSEPTDLWPKTPLFIEQSSVSALSHHDPSSAGFTTNIAESNIWYAQVPPSFDLAIDLLVEIGHRARAHPRAPQGLGDILHPPHRYARQVHLDQGFLHRTLAPAIALDNRCLER